MTVFVHELFDCFKEQLGDPVVYYASAKSVEQETYTGESLAA